MGLALERMVRMMMAAVAVMVLIRGTKGGSLSPAAAPVQFLFQVKHQCRFLNGTERVRYLLRHFYGRQELVRFDSDRGEFEAVTTLGEPEAEYWNSRKEILEDARRVAGSYCLHNYLSAQEGKMVGRRVPPSRVIIFPIQEDPHQPHILLFCTATGFYPPESIQLHWLRNGQVVKEGVGYEEEVQNGDWTYQQTALLETELQPGDTYACQVGHLALETPITVQWEPWRSNSAWSKLWTGVVGTLLGLVFGAIGLYLHMKRKKAIPIQPPTALIS